MAQMTDTRQGRAGYCRRFSAFASVLMLISVSVSSLAQTPTAPVAPPGQFVPSPQAEPQPTPAAPQQQRPPGFLESVGRWMDESAANMNKNFGAMWQGAARNSNEAAKASSEATSNLAKGAADAAKGTADALGKLGTGRIATGRARCVVSANGAPDCRQAAEQLCRSKGFSGGTSMEHETSEKCPALVLLRGNKQPGECAVEHTITRAMCQ
jgi:hypothetical protein